jgi:hypothetical protein
MAIQDYTKFKGVAHYGNDHLSDILEANLKVYYDWALLGIGGWTDVNIPQSGAYGGDFSELRLVDDPSYTAGQVWEGVRKDWVWETGVDYIDATGGGPWNPTPVGTPEVNGVPTAASYHVNYKLGRIVFDSPISTSSTVKVDHSFRDAQVYRADDAPWFRELQFQSFRVDSDHFGQTGSGDWSIGAQHRVQLPTIILEMVPRGRSSPFALGDGSLMMEQDVMFHVLAESRTDRNRLKDIIQNQSDKSIYLFNTNTMAASGDYPLDYRGELVGSMMYPTMVEHPDDGGHQWRKCDMMDATVSEVESIHPNLYEAVIRTRMEIVLAVT